MGKTDTKIFVRLPYFDPLKGTTVREPEGSGKGYWVGAPSALFSETNNKFYIAYRVRAPPSLSKGRGRACEIAESEDGIKFATICRVTAESLNTKSIEKSALFCEGNTFSLYISYVDPDTSKWRIDLIRSSDPSKFDPEERIPVLDAGNLLSEGVKDPCIFKLAGKYYMMASYIPNYERIPDSELHKIADASAIGLAQVYTVLLSSDDGVHFRKEHDILQPGSNWDRLSTVGTTVMYSSPMFVIFFDGRRDASDSYEGKAGLAITRDFVSVKKLDIFGPRFRSPYASGSLRYVDAVQLDDKAFYYYEFAREDGSHELRVNVEENL